LIRSHGLDSKPGKKMTKSNVTYFVKARNSGDGWIKTNAKTERGAKNVVSKMYSESAGNSFLVGVSNGVDIVEIAIKSAFEAWRTI